MEGGRRVALARGQPGQDDFAERCGRHPRPESPRSEIYATETVAMGYARWTRAGFDPASQVLFADDAHERVPRGYAIRKPSVAALATISGSAESRIKLISPLASTTYLR